MSAAYRPEPDRATKPFIKATMPTASTVLKAPPEIVNWQALVQQKQQLVDSLRKAKYEDLLPEYPNISYVEGRVLYR